MTSVRNIVCGLVICSFTSFGAQSALAEDMRKDQMVKSLKAKPSFWLQARTAEKAARPSGVAPSSSVQSAPSASSPSHHRFAHELRHLSHDSRRITEEERKKEIEGVRHGDLP